MDTRIFLKNVRRMHGKRSDPEKRLELSSLKNDRFFVTEILSFKGRGSYSGKSNIRDGPNTVSENTVSNTELSEFFGPHRVPGRELSEFLSAYYLCDKANSPSFRRTPRVCPKTQ